MNRKAFFLMFLVSFTLFGCAATVVKTELDQLFEKNFEGFEIPEVRWIKEGVSRSYPYTTFPEAWDATILVLMQQGVVVRSSKDTGTLVTVTKPPLAIFVEQGEVVTVYLNWMGHLYRRADKPEVTTIEFKSEDAKKIGETFFDKLATQVYAGEKWKWLRVKGEK